MNAWLRCVCVLCVCFSAKSLASEKFESPSLPLLAAVESAHVDAYGPVVEISPDESKAAFAVTELYHAVYVLSLTSRDTRRLTPVGVDAWSPKWSNDGKKLAYFVAHGADVEARIWDVATDTTRVVDSMAIARAPAWMLPLWTRDGASLVVPFKQTCTGQSSQTPNACGATSVGHDSGDPDRNIRVFRSHRRGYPEQLTVQTPPWNSGIALLQLATSHFRVLFKGVVDSYQLSPDGRQLAILERSPKKDVNVLEISERLHIVDLSSEKSRTMADGLSLAYGKFSWSPDGRYLAWVNDYTPSIGPAFIVSSAGGAPKLIHAENGPVNFAAQAYDGSIPVWDARGRLLLIGQHRLWTIDPASAKATPVSTLSKFEPVELIVRGGGYRPWSTDRDRSVVALVRNNDTYDEAFARITVASGALSKLHGGNAKLIHFTSNPSVSRDGKWVIYSAEKSGEPPALWWSDQSLKAPRRVVPLNPALEGYVFGQSRLIHWVSTSGQSLSGALLLPSNYEPGQRYPLIVDVYGGSLLSKRLNEFGCGDEIELNLQAFATRGYAILLPDAPLRVGTPVQDLTDDVLPGLDAAVATGAVDSTRMGVIGHSYGGYSAVALVSRTDRFRAAVAVAAQADLLSSVYGNAFNSGTNPWWAEGPGQGRMGGTPWEFRERYIENSPSWSLDHVHTPLLLLHGTSDEVVPVFESTLIFKALQRLGREVEYVQYVGDGHSIVMGQNSLDAAARVIAWFDEHLNVP